MKVATQLIARAMSESYAYPARQWWVADAGTQMGLMKSIFASSDFVNRGLEDRQDFQSGV